MYLPLRFSVALLCFLFFLSFLFPPQLFAATSSAKSLLPSSHDDIIVEYKPGQSPEELQTAIQTQQSQSLLGKLKNAISSMTNNDPAGKLRMLSQEQSDLGVTNSTPALQTNDTNLKRFYVLHVKPGTNREAVKQKLSQLGFVQSAMVNQSLHTVSVIPNDYDYQYQWDMGKIRMPEAWDVQKGSKSVIVAVVDTGIDFSQPDLPTDIIHGLNTFTNGTDSTDDYGHGTHIAGTIGAMTNNSVGVSGMNWQVRLMSVKSLDSTGSGDELHIAEGIRYAADNGAKVINLSVGGPGTCDSFLQSTINYALQKNVAVVVAAGNSNVDVSQIIPASCPGVISVAATDQTDERASFSDYGSQVTLSAPGVWILSTKSSICSTDLCAGWNETDNNYVYASGTSMAAPHVAGAAALLLAANPMLTPSQLSTCLVSSAQPITTDQPIGPRLDVMAALQVCGATTITPSPTTTLSTPISIDLLLHGLGTAGDSVSPGVGGNMQPLHPSRQVTISFYNSTGQLVGQQNSTVTFQSSTGHFTGTVNIGTSIQAGNYILKITTPQFLTKQYPGFVAVSLGQSITLPVVSLVTGDVNNDNQLNILDYTEILGCYSDLAPATNCDPMRKLQSDLDDDGNVNQVDYNLFLREITVQTGS